MNPIRKAMLAAQAIGLRAGLDIVTWPLRKARMEARFARPQRGGQVLRRNAQQRTRSAPADVPRLSSYEQPDGYHSCAASGQTVTITFHNASLAVTVLAPDLMRLHPVRAGDTFDTFSYAVARPDGDWPPVPFTVRLTDAMIEIATERLVCRVETSPCCISLLDPQRGNAPVCTNIEPCLQPLVRSAAMAAALDLANNEHIYGLGEKASGIDRRGHVYEMWNGDPNGAYGQGKDPLYLSIPFFMGLRSDAAYGIFFDNTWRSRLDFGVESPGRIVYHTAGGPLRCYVFHGPTATTVLDRYTELTGRMRMPPLWALGYHQSRWSYTPDSRVRKLAGEFRRRHIPCDAIHLDIHYMDGYRCFTWHPRHFPDPAGLIAGLHSQGFRVVPLIDCGIKRDASYAVCANGLAEGVFCTLPNGEPLAAPVWAGNSYFPDFTSPRVRAWWGEQQRTLLDIGVDGIWNDMNEPTVFGGAAGALPDFVLHDLEGRGAFHAEAHNVYGLEMARACAESIEQRRPHERTFVLTRSGWAGLQRFAINWMGDNISNWDSLRLTVPMIANLGLSGLAFTGPDTGGFAGDCQPELLARWLQLGVFTPLLRNHSALQTAAQEPWAFGESYESINRRAIELRYHLLPYIYSAFWQCSRSGLPMLRPLFLHWQNDEKTHSLADEFMFGDSLLVAPVVEARAVERNVYLPAGRWFDWWTGEQFEGGQTVRVDAPLDRLPLFARAGSIVPGWPVMQYTGQRPVDVLELHVFWGDGESTLYEDDGRSMDYRQGLFRVTRFTMRTGPSLTIERQVSGAFEPGYRQLELTIHGASSAARAAAGGRLLSGASYDEQTRTMRVLAPLASLYTIALE
jgi:alpha-glucosidase